MAGDRILVDTGPLVALLNEHDQHHAVCLETAKQLRGPFVTCWPVVTEAAYLLRRHSSAFRQLLTRLRIRQLELLHVDAEDIEPVTQILARYADHDLGIADAILMHLAAREDISTVFTIDRRHFAIDRLADGRALEIWPSD